MGLGCTLSPFEARMHVELTPEGMVVRPGSDLTSLEETHVQDAVRAFAPLPAVTVDLTRVGDLPDASLVALARGLVAAGAATVQLRGGNQHQARLLRYCLGSTGQA
jgi:hypothetical protein